MEEELQEKSKLKKAASKLKLDGIVEEQHHEITKIPFVLGGFAILYALFNFLSFFGYTLISIKNPHPILISYTAFTFIIGLLFFIIGIGMITRKKWSYLLGMWIPAIDILIGFIIAAILKNIVPSTITESEVGWGMLISFLEIIFIYFVHSCKYELGYDAENKERMKQIDALRNLRNIK